MGKNINTTINIDCKTIEKLFKNFENYDDRAFKMLISEQTIHQSKLIEILDKNISLDLSKDQKLLKLFKNQIVSTFGSDLYLIFEKLLYSYIIEIPRKKIMGEKTYHIHIKNNFAKLFPAYIFIGSEVITKNGTRIDLLAKCSNTERIVIIELKIGKKNGRRQLRDYAVGYENPILINISEEIPLKTTEDIIYLTYKGIGVEIKRVNN